MIAVGIGCRSGARKEAIVALIVDALARTALSSKPAKLFSYEGKRGEEGLHAAARELGMPLAFLSRDALQAMMGEVTTRSEAAAAALGIASVAEAAALAGCGKGGRLLLPRMSGDGVTCAIAGDNEG